MLVFLVSNLGLCSQGWSSGLLLLDICSPECRPASVRKGKEDADEGDEFEEDCGDTEASDGSCQHPESSDVCSRIRSGKMYLV